MYPKKIAIYNSYSVLLYSGDVAIYRTLGTDERQTGHCGNSHGNRSDLSSKRGRWPKGRDDKNDDDIAQW